MKPKGFINGLKDEKLKRLRKMRALKNWKTLKMLSKNIGIFQASKSFANKNYIVNVNLAGSARANFTFPSLYFILESI